MPLNYNPKDASNAFEAGEYLAELTSVVDKESKSSGNPMQVWSIKVEDENGRKLNINEYVTASAAYKIKMLASAIGKLEDFENQSFQAEDYIGSSFMVELTVEKTDQYGDQNRIKKYKPSQAATPVKPVAPKGPSPADLLSQAKRRVMDALKAKHPDASTDQLMTKLNEAVAAMFPGQKIGTLGVMQFDQMVKHNFKPIESPISEEQQFKDDDIPF